MNTARTPADTSHPETERPHVVVIGAGFAGLEAIRNLRRGPVRITVIDHHNHHLFQPLLYQVATAALNPSDIASPIRRILRHQTNAEVLLAEAESIDVTHRRVVLANGDTRSYDFLVVATGVTHSYFGHEEWARHAPGLKTIEDALKIRSRMLLAFERAERETDPSRRPPWMTFVVIGGGPTGVELAGTLSDIARHTLARDFRHIDSRDARIVLAEAAPRVLPSYDPALSEKAQQQLEARGIEVLVGRPVTEIDEDGVGIGDDRIEARTVIWAAGVAASPLARSLGVALDRAGRVPVGPDLTIPGHDKVYVIGDLAHVEQDGKPVPGVAPAAIQQGRHTARNIRRTLRGQPREPFRYVDKGSLATIGRAAAVAEIQGVKLSGFLAWILWLFVHIFFLIGFRNRLLVLIQWAWLYVTYDRGARLITEPEPTRVGP